MSFCKQDLDPIKVSKKIIRFRNGERVIIKDKKCFCSKER